MAVPWGSCDDIGGSTGAVSLGQRIRVVLGGVTSFCRFRFVLKFDIRGLAHSRSFGVLSCADCKSGVIEMQQPLADCMWRRGQKQ